MTENEKPPVQPDDHVKKFQLPRKHLDQEEFVRCVQESGIVNDVATIHRLFDALTDGEWRYINNLTSSEVKAMLQWAVLRDVDHQMHLL